MKKTLHLTAIALLSVMTSGFLMAAEDYVPGQVIVKYRHQATARTLGLDSTAVKSFHTQRTNARTRVFDDAMADYAVVNLPKGMTVERAIATFSNDPSVESVSPNRKVHAFVTPNDTQFSGQWDLQNTGQTINSSVGVPNADIHATQGWDIETGASHQVIVAVLDSGIDYTHADLAANIWTNPGEIPGNGIDDDGNGVIDDVHGAKFNRASGPPTGDPMDDFFHGTHVAGTIGAVTNNSNGVAGVCWSVKLMAVKFLDSSGSGDVARGVEGIQYAVANGANIINNSWGTGVYDATLDAAFAAAKAAGVTITAAAGNDNNSSLVYWPAGLSSVSAVAGSNNKDKNLLYNYGPHIDIAAPGKDILSTSLSGTYIRATGTSMATPHISGAAALLKAHDPSLTPDQIQTLLVNSVDIPATWDDRYGPGRLNIYTALRSIGDTTAPTVSVTNPANGANVAGTITVDATASDNVTVTRVQFLVDGVVKSTVTSSPFTTTVNTVPYPDGVHTITAKAFDGAGNSSQSSVTVNVLNNDAVPPTVSITDPLNNQTIGGTYAVNANATDNVAISKVWFFIDGVLKSTHTTSPYIHNFITTNFADGVHTISARAFDLNGNTANDSISVYVLNNDTVPPTVAITAPHSGDTVLGNVVLQATATDNVSISKVRFLIDGSTIATLSAPPYTWTWNSGLVADGSHQLMVRATDIAGNVGVDSFNFTVQNNDTTPPTIAITSPHDGDTISGTVNFMADANDNLAVSKVWFMMDGVVRSTSTTLPYKYTFSALLETEGPHTMSARAFDVAGNNSSQTINVTVSHTPTDFEPPVVSITSPANGAHVSGTITVSAAATDNVSVARVECYVDAALLATDTLAPYAFSWNADAAAAGTHTILVKAYDPDGNMASASITVTTGGGQANALAIYQPLFSPARGESVSVPLNISQLSHVKARVLDRTGALVVTLVDDDLAPGTTVNWDGRNDSHSLVASGTYLMLLEINGKVQTKKIIVRK